MTNEKNFHGFGFDWDDNILHMPTKIKMDKKVGETWVIYDVEPAEFALIRCDKENYRIRNNDPSEAFDEFVDFGPRGDKAFLEDVKIALDKKDYGPCWETLLECLINGKLFSIVTSRSHEYASIRKGVEYIVNNILTLEQKKEMYNNCCGFGLNLVLLDGFAFHSLKNRINIDDFNDFTNDMVINSYLNNCRYYGVGLPFSNSFKEEFKIDSTQNIPIQEAKKLALNKFIELCNIYSSKQLTNFSVGFSDDDKKTVDLIKEFFKQKSVYHPTSKLFVYDTSNRKIKNGVRTKYVAGTEQIK